MHYRFTRRPHISSDKMLAVELIFKNTSDSPMSSITIGDTRLQKGMSMRDTNGINQLAPGSSSNLTVGVNFNDTLQPAKFDIWCVMNVLLVYIVSFDCNLLAVLDRIRRSSPFRLNLRLGN